MLGVTEEVLIELQEAVGNERSSFMATDETTKTEDSEPSGRTSKAWRQLWRTSHIFSLRDIVRHRGKSLAAKDDVRRQCTAHPMDDGRFSTRLLVFGRQEDVALGIEHFMCVSKTELIRSLDKGLGGIRAEFEALGDKTAVECMQYVLDHEAGSSAQTFPNSPYPRDCGPDGVLESRTSAATGRGMVLNDFFSHPHSRTAKLELTHVAALRIYTTAAFLFINAPLRDLERKARGESHALPLTTMLIAEAISKLRAVGAKSETANMAIDLWRGMKNVEVLDQFAREGGTELAPLSTTSDIRVAVKYAVSENSVLLKLQTTSALGRGADISYLSAFPAERECLFPPLTYLEPVETTNVEISGTKVKLFVVQPRM